MFLVSRLVDELCASLVRFEPGCLTGAESVELAERLARAAKVCATASARAAARAAECGVARDGSDASVAEWMARVGGTTSGAARAALATVKAVESCPATRDALFAGAVSLAQAAEIVSVPAHEAELLEIARSSGLGRVKDVARKRRLEGIEPEELHARQRAARKFVHWKDKLGMVRFRGALPPEVGVPFVNRLETETDREWRQARQEKRLEARVALAADAFVRMVAGGGAAKSKSADVVVVADLNAYRRGHAHPGEVCHIEGGGPIPVSVVREMAKDGFLKAVLHDGVAVHTVAHFGRHRPARLEIALMLGAPPEFDGITCTELGCNRKYGLEWDHVDPVANGGTTSKENLKPRCSPHHWDKTGADRKAGLLGSRASVRRRAP